MMKHLNLPSLLNEYHGQGIGTRLMYEMIKYLRESGYKQTSLNVKKKHYVVKLYKKMGFEIISTKDKDSWIVLK